MRKNAFTLIELLAVIVILAIIALIATPIILGIIKDAKENANKRSAENYIYAVEQAIVRENMNGIFKPTECIINPINAPGKVMCVGYTEPLNVEIDGEVPEEGTIYLDKGKVAPGTSLIYNNGYKTIMNEEGKLIPLEIYNDGDIVYIDITTGKSCTNYHEDNSKTGYKGINGTGNQTSCLKFYAFLDDGGEKLNLLLDHNTTDKLRWNSSGSNKIGPSEVIQKLYEDTKEWNVSEISKDYTLNQSTQPSQANYTIEYSKIPSYEGAAIPYKARLMTANEIAKITGADKEDTLNFKEESSIGKYYLDGAKTNDAVPNWQTQVANSTNKSDYYWLFDRTSGCLSYGCLNNSDVSTNGYWTSSAHANDSNGVWHVNYRGYVDRSNAIYATLYGVRPVIEVLKSNL